MRLLWVGKADGNGGTGQEIYDRRIIGELEAAGVRVSRFAPQPVPRAQELWNLARGVPYYRARYASARNRSRLRAISTLHDAAICSWEPFDQLATEIACPALPILHNITSRSLPSAYPQSRMHRALARRASHWERNAYGGERFLSIAVLARGDEGHIERLRCGRGSTLYAPPGIPPLVPLGDEAVFVRRLLISGTFDWHPKRRDLLTFAQDLTPYASRFEIVADTLPEPAGSLLRPFRQGEGAADGIGIGVIPDRFVAGHKLKAGAYIAANAVVASLADISAEFAGLPDAGFFVRHVSGPSDIAALADELAATEPEALRRRMRAFKSACAERFSWSRSAQILLEAASAMARK